MQPSAQATSPASQSYCRFTTGRPARSLDGRASLMLAGIEIDLGHGEPRRVWKYETLRALEPLRGNAIDVLLSSREEPGANLFVQGREFAAGLKEYAPHLSARADRWRRSRPWVFLLAVAAVFLFATYALGWSPLRSVAGVLPESWRQRLGDAARASMTEGHKQCADANGLTALTQLTERLSKASPVNRPFKVRVYDWPLMNAFAVPGGQIVLTKGLLEKAESPDEVAGVLAHEMGHGIEMHPETGIIRNIGLAAAVELMMGGSAGTLANAGLMLAQLGYSRSSEREADRDALVLLKGAGIPAKGLGDFFARVIKADGEEADESKAGGPFSWLRTHPPTAERIALVRHQTDYPSTPALDAQAWQELRSICRTTLDLGKVAGEE